jgi:uncharacterized membrane protein
MLYRIFVKGLLTILPITVTLYLLAWIVGSAEELFGGPLRGLLPAAFYVPGFGVALALLLIFLVGLLVNHYIASRVVIWLEETLQNVPFIKTIYNPLRDVMNLFASDQGSKMKRVVMVEMEGLGCSVLGLGTRDSFDDFAVGTVPKEHVAVFVPYSYAVGGFTLLVPKARVREVDIAPERAMQLAITAWIKSEKRAAVERPVKPQSSR